MTKATDITGRVFGHLTAIRRDGGTPHGGARWLCRCVCGKEVTSPWASLKTGRRKSCGCAHRTTFADTRICSRCKTERPHAAFRKGDQGNVLYPWCRPCTNEVAKARYHADPERGKARQKGYRDALRVRVLAAYGNKCACCGESEPAFLAIDHVNNDGAAHRKSVGNGDAFYRWLEKLEFPSGFQCLCANCNWGKHVNGGVCPHKQGGKHVCLG